MKQCYQPTLRDRLKARRNLSLSDEAPIEVPPAGLIPAAAVAAIERLAKLARAGDIPARDRLYTAVQPRLHRKGFILRPWPNSPDLTGLWDRDDVQQESWIIFAELLAAWDGTMPFVPYLLARFPWRLRDRILRGIGKPLPPMGAVRVPESLLADVLAAHDSDQPESALLANKLLEHLLQGMMVDETGMVDPRTVMTILQSPQFGVLRRKAMLPDDGHPFSQIEAA